MGNPDSSEVDFTVFTTLRYEPTAPFHDPATSSSTSQSSPFYSLPAHIARLQASASAASWLYPKTTFWGSHSPSTLLTHLSTSIPSKVAQAHAADPSVPVSQPWRIRIDLSSPSAGGDIQITVGKTNRLPDFRGFDPFYPTRLPSPEELDDGVSGAASRSGTEEWFVPSTWDLRLADRATVPGFHTRYKTSRRAVYDEARGGIPISTEVVLHFGGEVVDGTISSLYFWRDGRWVTPRAEAGGLKSVTRDWALERGVAVEGRVEVGGLRRGEVVWCSNGLRGFGWGRFESST